MKRFIFDTLRDDTTLQSFTNAGSFRNPLPKVAPELTNAIASEREGEGVHLACVPQRRDGRATGGNEPTIIIGVVHSRAWTTLQKTSCSNHCPKLKIVLNMNKT